MLKTNTYLTSKNTFRIYKLVVPPKFIALKNIKIYEKPHDIYSSAPADFYNK